MEKTLFLIFNHRATSIQKHDARKILGVEKIKELPPELKKLWCTIPADIPQISDYLGPVKKWIHENAKESDYVLIQGDFGACYIMVNFVFNMRLIPVYSTTVRDAFEEYSDDGSVKIVHNFKHHIFRKYEKTGQ